MNYTVELEKHSEKSGNRPLYEELVKPFNYQDAERATLAHELNPEVRLKRYQFNLFKGGIKIRKPTSLVNLADVVALINGPTYEITTRELRNFEPELQKVFKANLDYVTFSGSFAPSRLVSNLKKHSGLLCLDFDKVANLWETRLQLQADPHTLVLFTSPTGTGLKLIIAAPALIDDPSLHKSYFVDLSIYIQQMYGLDVDASGSDVSRACFMVHDPQAFINEQADDYTYKGLAQAAHQQIKKPKTEFQTQKESTGVYKHVLAVVERIEAAQVNITGDEYHNNVVHTGWLILAFCMSTLGEPGRELFHRISRFSEKYDPTKTDEKFNEAVNKCRFTTPWKFFDIAKKYGIDVSKPVKVKKDKLAVTLEAETSANAPDKAVEQEKASAKPAFNWDTNGTVTYDKDEFQIRVKSGKSGYNTIADNFLLYIKYVTEDEFENLTWVLEIKPEEGDSIFVEVPHEDFNSASRLKRLISGKQFALKISDSELSELHAFLFARTHFSRATKIIRFGYHAPSSVYFFANKAVNVGKPAGKLLEPDSFSMIQIEKDGKPIYLSMPSNNKHKANRFALTDQLVSVNAFFQVYAQAHGYENAMIPFCFYLMALYRDLALKHKNFSPILFLKGGAGTGKSSMIRVLTAAFGRKQEGVNLKAKNTESALSKLMSQSSNAIIWFDEYHNEITCEGLLQAAYDNDGYHLSKAGTVGTNETGSIDIYTALALTSNYIPQNEIFFSRCVFVSIASQDKTDDQVVAFNQLEEWQEGGLGCLTLELLKYRQLVEKEYGNAFDLLLKKLKAEFRGEKIPERFYTNMAQLLTVGLILNSAGHIALTESCDLVDIVDEFVRIGAHTIRRQHRIMSEKTALSEFFEIIQQLYDQYTIHEEIHFDFKVLGGVTAIELWFPQLYNLYAQYYRRINQKAPADRDQLQNEIAAFEDQPDWEAVRKQIRFMNDGQGNSTAKTIPRPNSCTMDYMKLKDKFGINLESRKQKS